MEMPEAQGQEGVPLRRKTAMEEKLDAILKKSQAGRKKKVRRKKERPKKSKGAFWSSYEVYEAIGASIDARWQLCQDAEGSEKFKTPIEFLQYIFYQTYRSLSDERLRQFALGLDEAVGQLPNEWQLSTRLHLFLRILNEKNMHILDSIVVFLGTMTESDGIDALIQLVPSRADRRLCVSVNGGYAAWRWRNENHPELFLFESTQIKTGSLLNAISALTTKMDAIFHMGALLTLRSDLEQANKPVIKASFATDRRRKSQVTFSDVILANSNTRDGIMQERHCYLPKDAASLIEGRCYVDLDWLLDQLYECCLPDHDNYIDTSMSDIDVHSCASSTVPNSDTTSSNESNACASSTLPNSDTTSSNESNALTSAQNAFSPSYQHTYSPAKRYLSRLQSRQRLLARHRSMQRRQRPPLDAAFSLLYPNEIMSDDAATTSTTTDDESDSHQEDIEEHFILKSTPIALSRPATAASGVSSSAHPVTAPHEKASCRTTSDCQLDLSVHSDDSETEPAVADEEDFNFGFSIKMTKNAAGEEVSFEEMRALSCHLRRERLFSLNFRLVTGRCISLRCSMKESVLDARRRLSTLVHKPIEELHIITLDGIRLRDNLVIAHQAQHNNVSFWVVPRALIHIRTAQARHQAELKMHPRSQSARPLRNKITYRATPTITASSTLRNRTQAFLKSIENEGKGLRQPFSNLMPISTRVSAPALATNMQKTGNRKSTRPSYKSQK